MPEWYNPNVGKGGWGFGNWRGTLAPNAYDSSKMEPYTGHFPDKDWLRDEQLAKMKILAAQYETEIMVCSIILFHGSRMDVHNGENSGAILVRRKSSTTIV